MLVEASSDLQSGTHRSVDGLVAIEVAILAQAVVSLAEGNTRNAASDQACVDWGEAREEG